MSVFAKRWPGLAMVGEVEEGTTRTGGRAATTGIIRGRYALSVGNPATVPPAGWAWTPLNEVARLETGHTPSRKHPEYWGGEIPWLAFATLRATTGGRSSKLKRTRTRSESRTYTLTGVLTRNSHMNNQSVFPSEYR